MHLPLAEYILRVSLLVSFTHQVVLAPPLGDIGKSEPLFTAWFRYLISYSLSDFVIALKYRDNVKYDAVDTLKLPDLPRRRKAIKMGSYRSQV